MIEPNFQTPQRQSLVGIVVIFLNILQKNVRAFLPLLIVMFVDFDVTNLLRYGIIAGSFLILILIYAFLDYYNFTFFIDNEAHEFQLNKGIFNKSITSIKLGKIQQVNLNQTLVQRILNVYEVKIDSAGSEETEVVIKAISQSQALSLKAQLLAFENAYDEDLSNLSIRSETTTENNQATKFLSIKLLTLIKVGITSNYVRSIGLILFVLYQIYDNFHKIGENYGVDDQSILNFFNSDIFVLNLFKIIALVLLIIFLINIIRTVFKFYNFQIKKQNEVLQISYGLLSIKNTMLKPERVQKITLSQNFFQKKFDIVRLFVGQIESTDREGKDLSIEIPGCSLQEKWAIFDLIYQKMPYEGIALKPNFRKLIKSMVLWLLIPSVVYFGYSYYVDASMLEFADFVIAYLIVVSVMQLIGFRNYRLYLSEDFVIKQSGIWDISYEIIEIKKIQNITLSQLFWYQSLNLGSIKIETAGGDIYFQTTNYSQLKNFTDLWLYKIERFNENWM